MEPIEFITFRGKLLEAKLTWLGNQEIIQAAIPSDHIDSATADVYLQQKIEIVPGLKITEKKSGTLFEILSKPEGYSRFVSIKDVRRNLSGINISEDELRQNYRFVG